MQSIPAYNILYFSLRTWYGRERHRELHANGQSPQEHVRSARQMMNICPSFPMHTCFLGLPSPLFSVHKHVVPSYRYVLSDTLIPIHYYTSVSSSFFTVTRLSASHKIGKPRSSPIYVFLSRIATFSCPIPGSSVWAAKVRTPDFGNPSSGRRRFAKNLHTPLKEGSIFHEKLV